MHRRFYDVKKGQVLVDNQNVRDVTLASLHGAVGMVPQDTVLFNDTILHNIRYGRMGATDEEVFEAAKAASIHDAIVSRFPQVGSYVCSQPAQLNLNFI